ncbi:hypothetical protein [Confluentibacter flavum]|uniref:Uncharacterized protein n=1 Tax=Confluentibacter flavum TaxID=1909700 RepID=A0A2N3HGW8_9FLAO|nr:hypothetical protein [Confluentibacter flavum]PKQ44206.1 hypothetical protein CSW08_13975 [Confluentibacter flavum]
MQHNRTFILETDLLEAIKSNAETVNDIFINNLDVDNSSILTLLNSYDYFDGTQGQVYSYTIDENSIYIDENGNGEFTVEFTAHHYYGCADLDKEYEHEMSLTFNINFISKEMVLIGEFWDERQEEEI